MPSFITHITHRKLGSIWDILNIYLGNPDLIGIIGLFLLDYSKLSTLVIYRLFNPEFSFEEIGKDHFDHSNLNHTIYALECLRYKSVGRKVVRERSFEKYLPSLSFNIEIETIREYVDVFPIGLLLALIRKKMESVLKHSDLKFCVETIIRIGNGCHQDRTCGIHLKYSDQIRLVLSSDQLPSSYKIKFLKLVYKTSLKCIRSSRDTYLSQIGTLLISSIIMSELDTKSILSFLNRVKELTGISFLDRNKVSNSILWKYAPIDYLRLVGDLDPSCLKDEWWDVKFIDFDLKKQKLVLSKHIKSDLLKFGALECFKWVVDLNPSKFISDLNLDTLRVDNKMYLIHNYPELVTKNVPILDILKVT